MPVAAAITAASPPSLATTTSSLQDLPGPAMQHAASHLDPVSRRTLRSVNHTCKDAVDQLTTTLLQLPLHELRRRPLLDLAAQYSRVSCLVVGPPEQRVSLSALGHRRRCEQLLAVSIDNASPFTSLRALDLSRSVSSMSAATLELLLQSADQLRHLALPSVAAGRGAAEVLQLLAQLPQLQTLQLDCRLFAEPACAGSTQQQHADDAAALSASGPLQQATALQRAAAGRKALTGRAFAAATPPAATPASSGPGQLEDQVNPQVATQSAALSAPAGVPSIPSSAGPCVTAVQLTSNNQQHQQTAAETTDSSNNDKNSSSTATSSAAASAAVSRRGSCCASSTSTGSVSNGSIPSSISSSISSSSSSTQQCSSQLQQPPTPLGMWSGLSNLSLQALQLARPCCTRELLAAVARLQGLRCFSLVEVGEAAAAELLHPGRSSASAEARGLALLAGATATALTRLELGFDLRRCSCGSSAAPRLIIPPHIIMDHHSSSGPFSYQCAWSQLPGLRVLLLSGVCLDSAALAAMAAGLPRLTELRVSGLLLEHDLQTLLPCGGWCSGTSRDGRCAALCMERLRLLAVGQRFCLGPNSARVLFPGLQKLSIRDSSSTCPDLSCLQHHPALVCLQLEAASCGWQLSGLQLGHLVHLPALKQLSLAASGCSSNSSRWLPVCSLPQVTSITLSGPVTDHCLAALAGQFPSLVTLQLLGSCLLSDWGIKALTRPPLLEAALLQGCPHVTSHSIEALLRASSLRVLAVLGCSGVGDKECQRIRRACRHSSTALHWCAASSLPNNAMPPPVASGCNGSSCCDAGTALGTRSSSSSSSSFLERCWREAQAGSSNSSNSSGPAADLDDWSLLWDRLLPPHVAAAAASAAAPTASSSDGDSRGAENLRAGDGRAAAAAAAAAADAGRDGDINSSSSRGSAGGAACSDLDRLGAGSGGYRRFLLQQQSYRQPPPTAQPHRQGGACSSSSNSSDSSTAVPGVRCYAAAAAAGGGAGVNRGRVGVGGGTLSY